MLSRKTDALGECRRAESLVEGSTFFFCRVEGLRRHPKILFWTEIDVEQTPELYAAEVLARWECFSVLTATMLLQHS